MVACPVLSQTGDSVCLKIRLELRAFSFATISNLKRISAGQLIGHFTRRG
jgi:hypothetical protein